MKKIKKILAAVMTLAMVLGMSMTTFAVEQTTPTSDIKVSNLAEGVATDLELHKIIYLDKTTENGVETQSWKLFDWVQGVTINSQNGEVTITDAEALKAAAEAHTADDTENDVTGTTYTFEDVSIGGYVILASDAAGTYGLMVANTYNSDAQYLEAENAEVIAKWEGHVITKEANDKFVHRGQTVNFTVTTTFPPKQNAAGTADLNTFKVIDKPAGLKITGITSIKIGARTLTPDDYSVKETPNPDGSTNTYEIDLSSQIENSDAGSKVEIKYTAVVYSDTEYNNNVDVDANTVDYTPASTKGFEANITVTKVNEDGDYLTGAQFQVLKDGNALWFIKTSEGVYKQALNKEESGATQTLDVSTADGTLKVTGLDEGEYIFKETKAPAGYSGGAELTVTVEDGDADKQVTITEGTDIVNTKLSSLPETGGIGTTIFTIGGCVIMIAAAGLFFASRRKSSK